MKITEEEVDAIFEEAASADDPHQQDYMVSLYKKAFPDWDDITAIDGWPKAGEKLRLYVYKKSIDFDSKFHPGVMAGGVWFNKGFGVNEALGDWEVSAKHCRVERK